MLAINKDRWGRPGEREKLAGLNRERWSDNNFKKSTSANIRAAWTPELRAQLSATKLKLASRK